MDPGDALLTRWRTNTAATGMAYLRSPAVHHLDTPPDALNRFARGRRKRRRPRLFAPPYRRPGLALFNAHCDRVVEAHGLADLHLQDRAVRCAVDGRGTGVQCSSGREVQARNVVLAIGASEQPAWPDWAPRNDPRVRHLFEPGFDGWATPNGTIAVVGGGISASQVALRLAREGHRVRLVSRHPLRQHQFDSDPGWLGPKFMSSFSQERDYDRRRALITDARHRGSVPPDVKRALSRAIARGQIGWHEGRIERLEQRPHSLELELADDVVLEAQQVLLATGFEPRRPGGTMVDELIESASLPCAGCGYPIPDTTLRWHPHVYVSGPLAELELGPASRNIAGARRAGERIVGGIRQRIGERRPTVRVAAGVRAASLSI